MHVRELESLNSNSFDGSAPRSTMVCASHKKSPEREESHKQTLSAIGGFYRLINNAHDFREGRWKNLAVAY
jgi:hypothetical protein